VSYRGFYINLDRSPDRRQAVEAQLARLGWTGQYCRFPANDGGGEFSSAALSKSELGCFVSHYRVLQQNIDSPEHLHIIEDDAVLAGCTRDMINQLIDTGLIDDHDLLLTDMVLPLDIDFYQRARKMFESDVVRSADGRRTTIRFSLMPYTACMASYIVNWRSIGRIHELLHNELAAGARVPIDILIRNAAAQGRLRVKCLFPFITSVLPEKFPSTLDRGDRDWTSDLAMQIARHSFYVECDQGDLLRLADRHLAVNDDSFHGRLLSRVMAFTMSSSFVRP
jgi:GR25 family glycosyltransferase involved in LPS biosynthesis